jgi:pilus assembly protein CpaB
MARVIAVSGAPESRNRLLIVAAGVFGVIAAALVFVALQDRSDSTGSTPISGGVMVVVAAGDLAVNTTLTAEMLSVQTVPPDVALSGAYERTDALLGKATRYPVAKGQQITSSVVGAGAVPNDDDLSYALPPGKRAVGVEVSEVTGVGGMLLPGNSVDVIAVLSRGEGASRAVTLLQNVVVLAVGQEAQQPAPPAIDGAGGDASAATSDAERQPDAKTVTLAVAPNDAQLVALAQEEGAIWLSLRPANDKELTPLGEQLLPPPSNPPVEGGE